MKRISVISLTMLLSMPAAIAQTKLQQFSPNDILNSLNQSPSQATQQQTYQPTSNLDVPGDAPSYQGQAYGEPTQQQAYQSSNFNSPSDGFAYQDQGFGAPVQQQAYQPPNTNALSSPDYQGQAFGGPAQQQAYQPTNLNSSSEGFAYQDRGYGAPAQQQAYQPPKPPPLEKWQKYKIRKGLAKLSDYWTPPPPPPVRQQTFFDQRPQFQPQSWQEQGFNLVEGTAAAPQFQGCSNAERLELQQLVALKRDLGGVVPIETENVIYALRQRCGF